MQFQYAICYFKWSIETVEIQQTISTLQTSGKCFTINSHSSEFNTAFFCFRYEQLDFPKHTFDVIHWINVQMTNIEIVFQCSILGNGKFYLFYTKQHSNEKHQMQKSSKSVIPFLLSIIENRPKEPLNAYN